MLISEVYKICFIGGTRYSKPLNSTHAKKFWKLKGLVRHIFVIGFSQSLWPYWFKEGALFLLLPKIPFPVLRYVEMAVLGFLLLLLLILFCGIQIIIAQSPYEGFIGAMAKSIARILGRQVALVVENHGDFEVSLFLQRHVWVPSLYRFLMRQIASFAFRHADILRAVSNSTRLQLERWAPAKPIVQFAAWTDIEVFLAAGERREQKKKLPEILYVGTLIPCKGVHFLVEAFARIAPTFPKARLVIIGKAENVEYAALLKRQVRNLGLDRQVEFLSPMSQTDLAWRMAKACVLVLPSLSEGLGRVVFEAMACGTPVIGSQVGGIPEMIKDGVNGFLVPPGNIDALADRLRWFLEHPVEARQMGQRAREFARKFFSSEAYIQNYARLFVLALKAIRRK